MNMNCWTNEFMNELRKFYKTSDLAFVYDVFLILLALAVATRIFCIKETTMCTNLQWKSGLVVKVTFLVV